MLPAVALIDGEHHPSVVRDALDRLERERGLAGVVFCGGEEKAGRAVLDAAADHYGRPVETTAPEAALRAFAEPGAAVVDLADEPVVPATRKLELAALALHLGMRYESPGLVLDPPPYAAVDFAGPKLAVIATGKRTGKTAVAGHWARLLHERGDRPVIVSMGRGGPPEPQLARAGTGLEDLLAIAEAGRHAASDYLEDAVLAGVDAVGCRRVGGGLAGEPFDSNVADGATLAAGQDPGAIVFEGSGSCIPPVAVDRTACIVGSVDAALRELGPYRLMRSDLVLAAARLGPEAVSELERFAAGPIVRFELRPEAVEPLPPDARVALFTTAVGPWDGVDPVVASANLARRSLLDADLERAAAEGCDVYLTELKAAAIDTVALRARDEGARVVFVRNRPVGLDADLDAELLRLHDDA
ncbi:MAG: cyclic 2,3-diphosphoglycerate synthase [Thermoleophilaceae bacterium]|nr:cyclic 2,3-diphosphoglycerate synthase [Thermoleophilaceae bacterium]MEA2353099.1 cyclic 2,3-diphosphoglycerate synthase [Thermoleophilaceae bacterium]MEA2367463.1 cyclic 2,3-diphosphoglycerate synthase [Thermoleophilaceae bacterium]